MEDEDTHENTTSEESKFSLFIEHTTLPGKRDEVRNVWERYMQPQIARNAAHEAYFYCYSDNNPNVICVYQQYTDRESSQSFLENPSYADYLEEVEPLLANEPEIIEATPIWSKE